MLRRVLSVGVWLGFEICRLSVVVVGGVVAKYCFFWTGKETSSLDFVSVFLILLVEFHGEIYSERYISSRVQVSKMDKVSSGSLSYQDTCQENDIENNCAKLIQYSRTSQPIPDSIAIPSSK